MTPPPAAALLPFEGFLRHLQRHGFHIGVDDCLRIQRVLEAAGRECEPAQLKTLLCPLLARNDRQQTFFHDEFTRWFEIFAPPGDVEPPPVVRAPAVDPPRRWPYVLAAVMAAAALGVTLLFTLPSPAVVLPPAAEEAPPAGPTSAPPPTTPAPTPTALPTVTPAPVEPTVYQRQWRALRWTAISIPPLVLLFYQWYRRNQWKAVLRRQHAKQPPARWPIQAPGATRFAFRSPQFYETARAMRRRHASGVREVDMPATVTQTIRALGRPTLVYRTGSRPPEYLVLIERLTHQDHLAALFDTLARGLEREDVFVSAWYFEGDPRRAFRDNGETVFLDELQERFHGHRLIVFSTGDSWLDPITGELADWASIIEAWRDRALLTPRPPAAWGWVESVLARDYVVLPATMASLALAIDAFESPDGAAREPNVSIAAPGATP